MTAQSSKCLIKNAIIIVIDTCKHESRVLRQIRSLTEHHVVEHVTIIAKWEPGLEENKALSPQHLLHRVRLRSLRLPRTMPWQLIKFLEWNWKLIRIGQKSQPGLIIAHSFGALLSGFLLKLMTGGCLLYDAHELETERNGIRTNLRKKAEKFLERNFLRWTDGVVVVGDAIADWYHVEYQIPRPAVIRNIPIASPKITTRTRLFHEKFKIPDPHLVFLYQGGFFKGRRIAQFLRIFSSMDRDRHLVLMGFGELQADIQAAANKYQNIHYYPGVSPDDLLRHTAAADIGLVGVENVCLSYYYSLPNKLFEYALARLPVIAPAYPEMRQLIEDNGLGWAVDDDDEAWRQAICAITPSKITLARARIEKSLANMDGVKEQQKLVRFCQELLDPA